MAPARRQQTWVRLAALAAALVPWCGAEAALGAADLAVVINDADPLSVAIGEYYVEQRGIPERNVIRVAFPSDKPVLASNRFKQVYEHVKAATPRDTQAYALTWNSPIRVNCMSITTAFAMGYGTRHCAKGCRAIAPNPYFDSDTDVPYEKFRVRPSMMVAATTFENAKSLIDRGIASDYQRPQGTAYLVTTPNKSRNSRGVSFATAKRTLSSQIAIETPKLRGISDKNDVMFYFTGITHVPHLDTLEFLPGAIADHLTSAGGRLLNSPQMSALRWLEAGATGSYGTVVEPCNFPQKFPDPTVLMRRYLAGDTLVEAYWKSVIWPGQGLFIGEPLAKPYANDEHEPNDGTDHDG